MNYLYKTIKHTQLVFTHKYYVFKNCCRAGIPIKGILHDLSKLHPVEFFESVKYYNGKRSPIDECKEDKGYSLAWFHHRGRNKHHWEHWVDNLEKGMTPTLMPYEYALEMVCDWLGAGQAYEKENWSFESQFRWWKNKKKVAIIHPVVKYFVDYILYQLYKDNSYDCIKNHKELKMKYNTLVSLYNSGSLKDVYWVDIVFNEEV